MMANILRRVRLEFRMAADAVRREFTILHSLVKPRLDYPSS